MTGLTGGFRATPYADGTVKVVRKLIALLLYAVLLLPGAELRMTTWLKAVEASTAIADRTMRRRKSRVENDRMARYIRAADGQTSNDITL